MAVNEHLTFKGSLQGYLNAPDLNGRSGGNRQRTERGGRSDRDRGGRSDRETMARLFISVGQIDLEGKGEFLRLICDNAQISGSSIGRIDLRAKHTFFDVEQDIAETVINKLQDVRLDGRQLRVNRDEGHNGGGGNRRGKGKRPAFKKSSRGRSYAR